MSRESGRYSVLDQSVHPRKSGLIVRVIAARPDTRTAERGARRTAQRRLFASVGTSILRRYQIADSTTLYTVHVY